MNHSRFPKEDQLPDWARREKQGKNGDRVEGGIILFFRKFGTYPPNSMEYIISGNCNNYNVHFIVSLIPVAIMECPRRMQTFYAV